MISFKKIIVCLYGIAKNYRGSSIAVKNYNILLRNRIETKIEKILRKNQNGFRRNRSTTSQILSIRRVRTKNLKATLLFVDFSQAFDPLHRWMMEQILLAYGLPPQKKTIAAIMMQDKNTKIKVR